MITMTFGARVHQEITLCRPWKLSNDQPQTWVLSNGCVLSTCLRMGHQVASLCSSNVLRVRRHVGGSICTSVQIKLHCAPHALPLSLEEEVSPGLKEDEMVEKGLVTEDTIGIDVPTKPNSKELKSLLTDSARSKLLEKLSEANQYNRHLKRQLKDKDDALFKCSSELAVIELELQALITIAEEVARSGIMPGTRKINGRYIQSHLLSRLEALHEKLKGQIKDVDAAKIKEVTLSWYGMAEDVQVMGSFDGWSLGEQMSPEYTGGITQFSTTLKLRPGKYEVKFLVDGQWRLSRELPTTGEGLTQNNLLVVE